MHPAVAGFQHSHQQLFQLLPVVVAPNEQSLHRFAERCVARIADLVQRLPRGAPIEVFGLLGNCQPAAKAGKQRLLKRQFAAEGIDGRDAQLSRQLKQLPTEGVRAVEGAAGQRVHGKLFA